MEQRSHPPPALTDDDDIMQLAIAMSLEGSEGSAPPADESDRFRKLRLALMVRLTDDLPELKKKGGVKSIHFLQVSFQYFNYQSYWNWSIMRKIMDMI